MLNAHTKKSEQLQGQNIISWQLEKFVKDKWEKIDLMYGDLW